MHGGNEQFCHVRVLLEKLEDLGGFAVRFKGAGRGCGMLSTLKETFLYLLGQMPAFLCVAVGVEISDHSGLCVARVALDSFDIAAADLELDRCAAMA